LIWFSKLKFVLKFSIKSFQISSKIDEKTRAIRHENTGGGVITIVQSILKMNE